MTFQSVYAQSFSWAKQFGPPLSDWGKSIAADAEGNVYITGYFYGTVDFNPGAGIFNLTSKGSGDVFITKLDASGNFIWAKQLGGTGIDYGFSIVADDFSNVYITGIFSDSIEFNPGTGTCILTSSGLNDTYILKIDSSGNLDWAKRIGGTSFVWGFSISIDLFRNVYITGAFSDTADFDPGIGICNLISQGLYDVFVHKMCQTTGLKEIIVGITQNVYPNPTDGKLNIELGKKYNEEIAFANIAS